MYVSCSLLACAKARYPTVAESLARLADLGFRAVDLDAFENWQHVNPSELAAGGEAAIDALAETIRASGLAVGGFNCGMSRQLTDPDPEAFARYRREFEALLGLAERVGCPSLTVQPGRAEEGREAGELLKLVARRLGELCDAAGPRGVSVGVEAHQGSLLEDPKVARRVFAELCPAAGLTYDPSHFAMQDIPLPETESLLRHAVHVHVRNAAPGKMQETMAHGVVDFDWLVAALKRCGYDGAVAIEYFSDFDPAFESVLALRDKLLACGVADGPSPHRTAKERR